MSIRAVPPSGGQPLTIEVTGRFEFPDHEAFRKAYAELPAETPVVVDFRLAEYMDSSALGMLLLLRRRAEEGGARVRLVNVPPPIRRILDIARFETLFEIG